LILSIASDTLAVAMGLWSKLKRSPHLRRVLGFEETIWTRKVPDEAVRKLVKQIQPAPSSVLEISGQVWQAFGFTSYQSIDFPEFDICTDILPDRFDLIICEHIFEHLLYPYAAAQNIHAMLNPSGHTLIVAPFLYQVHNNPNDCWRWTEQGLKTLLIECGFNSIATGSWGNRACIIATFKKEYRLYNRHIHSLTNEPQYPIVIWALAKK
jgi:SAM-dependent methyltransferase